MLDTLDHRAHQLLQFVKELDTVVPPNWCGLGQLDGVVAVSGDGIPLTWVPRQQITRMLVEAPDPLARDEVLGACRLSGPARWLCWCVGVVVLGVVGLVGGLRVGLMAVAGFFGGGVPVFFGSRRGWWPSRWWCG